MLIVDRFEGEYAVCELSDEKNTSAVSIEIKNLPENVKEGDVLVLSDNRYEICAEETEKRRKKIIGLSNSLFE